MHGQIVGAGGGELTQEDIGIRNHQVNVEGKLGHFLQRFDDRWTDRQVRYEMAVHDVDVQQIGSASFDRGHFVGQTGKIGGENRRSDQGGSGVMSQTFC